MPTPEFIYVVRWTDDHGGRLQSGRMDFDSAHAFALQLPDRAEPFLHVVP